MIFIVSLPKSIIEEISVTKLKRKAGIDEPLSQIMEIYPSGIEILNSEKIELFNASVMFESNECKGKNPADKSTCEGFFEDNSSRVIVISGKSLAPVNQSITTVRAAGFTHVYANPLKKYLDINFTVKAAVNAVAGGKSCGISIPIIIPCTALIITEKCSSSPEDTKRNAVISAKTEAAAVQAIKIIAEKLEEINKSAICIHKRINIRTASMPRDSLRYVKGLTSVLFLFKRFIITRLKFFIKRLNCLTYRKPRRTYGIAQAA